MKKIYIDKLPANHNKEDIVKNYVKNSKNCKIEFIYSSCFTNTKNLRDFIDIIWKILWFSEKQRSKIILISDELNNNAIEYWSDPKAFNIFRVNIFYNKKDIELNIEVEDNWKWKWHKTALDMETMRAHKLKRWYFNHESIRWRGLFLITVQIADRLYFKDSPNWWLIVWVKIFRKKEIKK